MKARNPIKEKKKTPTKKHGKTKMWPKSHKGIFFHAFFFSSIYFNNKNLPKMTEMREVGVRWKFQKAPSDMNILQDVLLLLG